MCFDSRCELGCPALLIDTWDKSAGNLLEHWSMDELTEFIAQVRARPHGGRSGWLSERSKHLTTARDLLPTWWPCVVQLAKTDAAEPSPPSAWPH